MRGFLRPLALVANILVIGSSYVLMAEDNKMMTEESKEAAISTPEMSDAEKVDTEKMKDDYLLEDLEAPPAPKPVRSPNRRIEEAGAFVVGPDWEFDGFVSGGEGDEVRSMFYIGDLVYPNVGSQQGLTPGDKIGIYKRGNKVRDPQSGKIIGYEVRRAAYARVTNRVEESVCAVRISSTYEPVEIGDLVRREE